MTTKNILFIVTNHCNVENTDKITGFHLSELVKPWKLLTQHHYNCTIASLKGGKVTCEPTSCDKNDPELKEFLDNPDTKNLLDNTRRLTDLTPTDFVGIFFVGGFGCMWDFPYDNTLNNFCSQFYQNNGVIGTVCHGTIVLSNIVGPSGRPLVEGKTISGFTNEEESKFDMVKFFPTHPTTHKQTLEDILRTMGGNFTKAEPMKEHVVRDERIVSGQNPTSSVGVAAQMLELLQHIHT